MMNFDNDTINAAQQNADQANPKTPKGLHTKYIAIAIAIVCIGGGGNGLMSCGNTNNAETEVVVSKETQEVTKKNVVDYTINVAVGPDNMRKYSYTGELVDTVGAMPNGKGIAQFAQYGNIPASTYEGEFVDGVCEDNTGNATMTFTTGDKYIGTFKGGYYVRGKYILADKSYFEGEFKNGSPYNGKWYTAAGELDGELVNGEDK